jgi:hypothetical protein
MQSRWVPDIASRFRDDEKIKAAGLLAPSMALVLRASAFAISGPSPGQVLQTQFGYRFAMPDDEQNQSVVGSQ